MYAKKAFKNNERFLIDLVLIRAKLLRDQKAEINKILGQFFIDSNKNSAITKLHEVRKIVLNLYVQITGTTNL
jgi:hypothetical protein